MIDDQTVELLRAVDQVASQQAVPFLLVGAFARELVLTHGYGINTHRATVDVDLGVEVSSWAQYEELRRGLLELGSFRENRQIQRLRFRNSLPVDLIPFGEIAQSDHTIFWPPEYAIRLDVTGFEDALRCCHIVRISNDPCLEICVTSLVGLAILKLSAWNDREVGRDRDAIDLLIILRNYLDAGNSERLWDEHPDIADQDDFDYELAGARLLGRDISAVASTRTARILMNVLTKQTGARSTSALILGMQKARPARSFEDVSRLLRSLLQGLHDRQ